MEEPTIKRTEHVMELYAVGFIGTKRPWLPWSLDTKFVWLRLNFNFILLFFLIICQQSFKLSEFHICLSTRACLFLPCRTGHTKLNNISDYTFLVTMETIVNDLLSILFPIPHNMLYWPQFPGGLAPALSSRPALALFLNLVCSIVRW